MREAPEIRSMLIQDGHCVEDDAALFSRLDNGKGGVTELRSAEESCLDCPSRTECISRLSELAVRFAEAGIKSTVIAGARLESKLPLPSSRAISSDETEAPVRQRLSRSYWWDGKLQQIEYRKLPEWFLLEFSEASSGSLLAPVRTLARERNSRKGIGGHIWNKHALTLKPYVKDLCLPREDFTNEDVERVQGDMCRFYSRIELNLDTFREPNISRLRALTEEYIQDCVAIKRLGYSNPLGVALNYSPDECAHALTNPKYTEQLTEKMIMQAFDQNANAHAMLDRFHDWFPEAQKQYAAKKSILTEGALRYLVFRAARQDDENRVDIFVQAFLDRFDIAQRLCVHLPFIRDHDIRQMALSCSSPEETIEALEERQGEMHELAAKYGLGEKRANRMMVRYRTDLEGKIRRYQQNVVLLQQEFSNDSALTLTDLMYFAEHNAASPKKAVRNFLHGIKVLQELYPTDDSIDEDAKRAIARMYPRNPVEGARAYLQNYQELKEQFGDDDYLQDWMLRQAALKPMGKQTSFGRASRLRNLVKQGGLNVSLDGISTDHDQSPQEAVVVPREKTEPSIDPAESVAARIEIGDRLLALTKTEREAVIYAFSLDWLFSDDIAGINTVARELNVVPDELEAHVLEHIVPKLRY